MCWNSLARDTEVPTARANVTKQQTACLFNLRPLPLLHKGKFSGSAQDVPAASAQTGAHPPAAELRTLLCACRALQPPATLQRLAETPDPAARALLPHSQTPKILPPCGSCSSPQLRAQALRCPTRRHRSVTPIPLIPPAPEQPGGPGRERGDAPHQDKGRENQGRQERESLRRRSLSQVVQEEGAGRAAALTLSGATWASSGSPCPSRAHPAPPASETRGFRSGCCRQRGSSRWRWRGSWWA